MIILDTDALSLVQRKDSPKGLRIRVRIAQLPADELVAITIITFHEQSKGWLAYIAKARTKMQQVAAYEWRSAHLDDYREARVLRYEDSAAEIFEKLRPDFPRLGTMDLRIAAIALQKNALLVSRNLRHFSQVPNLRVEDWTQ